MRVGFDLQSKGYSWEARYHWCSSDRPFLAYWEATLTMFRKPKHSDRCRSPVPLENPDESERKGNYTSFVILSSDAHFSCDIPSYSVLDPPFPRRPSAGEPGSAPPNRRAAEVRKKAPQIDLQGPPVVDVSVPPVERLALRAGHRSTRDRPCLASCRLSFVLDLESAARPTRTTGHFARGPRSDPQNVPGESRLGCTPHPRRAAQTRHRHRGEQRQQIHGALPQAAVADLAHLSGESCPAAGLHRLLHGAYPSLPGPIRVSGIGP